MSFQTNRPRGLFAVLLLILWLVITTALYMARAGSIDFSQGQPAGWPVYGQNDGGTRYSPLDQINRQNVSLLEVAWEYHTGDVSDGSDGRPMTTFQATPILVDGVLFVSTVYGRIIALEPETGEEIWTYSSGVDPTVHRGEFASRGVTHWTDTKATPGAPCQRRIFLGTIDARLIAVDAANGAPCTDFGQNGEVDLASGADLLDYEVNTRQYGVTSPPVILNDLVIVGSAIGDNRAVTLERGLVRAFDARSGTLAWIFDPIPRQEDDPAWETWEGNSALKTGAANVWAQLSVDAERGLVFVPTSSPSPDFYGGERLGSNLYADSVVALRGDTGEVAWYQQMVHHNLWDYDLPAQPTLVTVLRDGQPQDAVAQVTKMGFLFVLDRETGEFLFPVEERPVPQSTIPGELTWPTQPFPVLPPPLAEMEIKPKDAWGLTPWDRDVCRELIAGYRNDGIFTPPSVEGSIEYPGAAGGSNWGSLAYDPERSVAVLNQMNIAWVITLVPHDSYAGEEAAMVNDMQGTPYVLLRDFLVAPPLELPCNSPPWGTILAVDLNTGELKWEMPLGTIRDMAPVPLPLKWGTPNLGGPIITAGGLVFIGAANENVIRAFDIDTGRELWKGPLPAGGNAIPMTYQLGENDRQFLVIAAGGHGRLPDATVGDSVIAFALPDNQVDLLFGAVIETLYWVIVGLLVVFLLTRGRRILLNRWLWGGISVILVIVGTEITWLKTLSTPLMGIAFIVLLVVVLLLNRLRRYLTRRWLA